MPYQEENWRVLLEAWRFHDTISKDVPLAIANVVFKVVDDPDDYRPHTDSYLIVFGITDRDIPIIETIIRSWDEDIGEFDKKFNGFRLTWGY